MSDIDAAKDPARVERLTSGVALEWDKHPLVIAAGSAVATALFLFAVFNEVVVPTRLASAESKMEKAALDLEIAQKSLAALKAEIDASIEAKQLVHKELTEAGERIKALEIELLEAKESFLLSPGNPYPNGLSTIRIGASRDDVIKSFPSPTFKVETSELGYISVAGIVGPIDNVTYYFGEETGRVTHVLFAMDLFNKYPAEFLQKRLVEAFGEPTSNPLPHHFRWLVNNKWHVLKSHDREFVVLPAPKVTAVWPDE